MAQPTWSLESALSEFSSIFRSASESLGVADGLDPASQFALDGQAGSELRRLLPSEHRRRLGAFFTSHEFAHRLAEPLAAARGDVVVVDPSCGAGDLLVAAAQSLGPSQAAGHVSARLIGIDIVREFTDAARYRLGMLSRISGQEFPVKLSVADGRRVATLRVATHVLLNPPFASIPANQSCSWAQGNVNGAAEFLAAVISMIPQDCQVAAVLPEVLRGGSRYRRWREWVGRRVEIEEVTSVGRFDKWTDVDVFILRGRRADARRRTETYHWTPAATQSKISDRFNITVGPVVNNRDPEVGPLRPFLVARGLPPWGIIAQVTDTRRFAGRTHQGPFVAVARTSRPDEIGRARATIVTDTRPVAVDNHLLVLTPIDGDLEECRSLLNVLRSDSSDAWLDKVMRCRHLTVGAVGSLPWIESDLPVPSGSAVGVRLS